MRRMIAMARKGYGGFLVPVMNSIANAFSRELLVVMKRKKPYRGGARTTSARRIVEGKDKYGRPRDKKHD
jgi:hypothetical protein